MIVFNLNEVKITIGYERIVKKINLATIDDNLDYIMKITQSMKIANHLYDTLNHKIQLAKDKLESLRMHRQKRALFNALGTAIKFITGNVDNNDLEIINQSLGTLEKQENDIIQNNQKQNKINKLMETRLNNATALTLEPFRAA